MIERRYAACVNILGPCHSIYRWQGNIEESTEVAAIFKTSWESGQPLAAAITERHSYAVPAIAIWPIAATSLAYHSWVLENSGAPAPSAREPTGKSDGGAKRSDTPEDE